MSEAPNGRVARRRLKKAKMERLPPGRASGDNRTRAGRVPTESPTVSSRSGGPSNPVDAVFIFFLKVRLSDPNRVWDGPSSSLLYFFTSFPQASVSYV
jgi:hypothetical protein